MQIQLWILNYWYVFNEFNQSNEQKLFLQTGLMNVLYGVELSDKLVDNFATLRTSAHEQVDRCFGKLTNWAQTAGGMH